MRKSWVSVLCAGACLCVAFGRPLPVFAGDGATIVFKGGQVVAVDDGYRQIADTMKGGGQVLELTVAGKSVLVNLTEAVLVCRDVCSSISLSHQLDPRRGTSKATVNIDERGK